MGGGGGHSKTKTVIRYAHYIEGYHELFLQQSKWFGDGLVGHSPYGNAPEFNFNDALYSAGFSISSFPSLYDMFGKFMAGVNVESLWAQVLDSTQHDGIIDKMSKSHRDQLTEDLVDNVLPRFKAGMRDLNSVMTSSFVMGQALLEKKLLSKNGDFDAELRYKLLPGAMNLFAKHLDWNRDVVQAHITVMKMAVGTEMTAAEFNLDRNVKNAMWPFSILEQERANLGALQGARTATAGGGHEVSRGAKVLGGVASGAAMGSEISPGYGTVIGGVIGGIAGLFD